MADFEPPSFSLGIDFLFDSEPQLQANSIDPNPQNDVAEEFQVADSDPKSGPEQPSVFKRLKRGLPKPRDTTPLNACNVVDDDIEDFSSQDDDFEELLPLVQYRSMCSSSKIPLNRCGGPLKKESSEGKTKKSEPASTVTASTSHGEKCLSKLTVSPVRKFELIDSDSDDPSTSEENITAKPSVKQRVDPSDPLESQRGDDLWKDFTPIKSFHIPTPAFDGLYVEYFQSVKSKNGSEKSKSSLKNSQSIEQSWSEAGSLVPAHRYFLHRDSRIRKLVCDRLPNFFPLGIDDGASVIDYMGQFGNQEGLKRRVTQQVDFEGSSKRGRHTANQEQEKATQRGTAKKNSRKRGNNSTVEASESWVDPKRCKGTQRSSTTCNKAVKKGRNAQPQASSSRVGDWVDPRDSASVNIGSENRPSSSKGQSVGQWYTSNGQKVYVSKNGQELTGQMAYRQYKRDRGGNGRTKRKASSKKAKS